MNLQLAWIRFLYWLTCQSLRAYISAVVNGIGISWPTGNKKLVFIIGRHEVTVGPRQ